ncbi:MAG: proline dehydrogenase family protein [Bryobacterales bacterium]|nr:proline dehydrogenase family protein [Bryobacterales bacterium]
MLRNALLFLSRQAWLQRPLARSRVTRRLVARFIAGETLREALAVADKLYTEGILSTLDHLGEHVTSLAEAEASCEHSLDALKNLRNRATLSIKLTQFGLDISAEECLRLTSILADAARAADSQIEIDMESSAHTQATLDVVRHLHACYGNVRAVLQAYLYRTEADLESLCRAGIPVRLCKGAYHEPPEVAFPAKRAVDAHYRKLGAILLERGVRPAFATHDEEIIRDLTVRIGERGLTPSSVEFQMLYGIRRDLQRDLVRRGFPVRLYVPYGSAWYPYFMRRLAERPANLLFLLRALFQH